MARGGSDRGGEEQPSLFGEDLPSTSATRKRRGRAGQPTKLGARPSVATSSPALSRPPAGPAPGSVLAKLKGWAAKVVAEAFHKAAVKGVTVLLWVVPVVTIASFFALLKIDPWEKLGFYRDHVDKAEQIILGRTRPPVGESKVVTGSRPATPAPKEPEPPAPQPWTVDVYREGD